MISVLINWLYMGVITYLTGSLCLYVFGITPGVFYRVFAGILFVTCYAQIFSIFAALSLWANVGLLCVALLSAVLCRKSLLFPLRGTFKNADGLSFEYASRTVERKKRVFAVCFLLIIVFLFALCTSGPARQFDTNYYHAQTIRWLEEYGAVKGVANLFYPLANNNAGHYFDAIFSMKFLTGRSLHTTGGFFGLLIWLHGFGLFMRECRKQNRLLCAGLGMAEMVYAVIMTAYYADPYTDILPNALVFFVMSEWIIGMTKKEKDIKKIALLSVLALFAAICKLTVWPIALLMFVPLIQVIKTRNWKYLLCLLGTSLLTVLPTFATNAIISGYILYPVYFLDFLNVPWKLDAGILQWNVSSAVEFARLRTTDPFHPLNTGFSWLPFWIGKQATIHQVLYAYVLILFGTDVVCSLRKRIQNNLSDFDRKMLGLRAVCYLTLVYWFFTMPELRFVWSFIFIIIATVPVSLKTVYSSENGEQVTLPVMRKSKIPLFFWGAGLGFFLLYASLYGIRTIGYAYGGFKNALVMQADYERREGKTVSIDGREFVSEVTGEPYVCGYYLFPYFENYSAESRLMVGESMRDGFYIRK